ncbi:ATP-binding protein [Nonomuraea sp. 10N515B]|uniref:ATP-binding protein n=1 Tax=Nonomuraea sp. 10N515B TaxID=3457422 RepID=UPI003FCCB0C0
MKTVAVLALHFDEKCLASTRNALHRAARAQRLAGERLASPAAPGGRGIWLMRRLADQLGFTTGPEGTTVRLRMRLTCTSS